MEQTVVAALVLIESTLLVLEQLTKVEMVHKDFQLVGLTQVVVVVLAQLEALQLALT
jgi:hypothetical protein